MDSLLSTSLPRRAATTALLASSLLLLSSEQAFGQGPRSTKVMVGDVELHYIEQGQGQVVILLHGGQGDYRAWPSLIEALAPRYRVISYSRRYHWPNENPLIVTNHSALVDADDLAGLIATLRRRLQMPVLIVRGADTDELHRMVTEELARLLPDPERLTVPRAGHGSPRQNPLAFNAAVLEFLNRRGKTDR
jgi:pimeloyl-ACP methyl ester carboxylesterase